MARPVNEVWDENSNLPRQTGEEARVYTPSQVQASLPSPFLSREAEMEPQRSSESDSRGCASYVFKDLGGPHP